MYRVIPNKKHILSLLLNYGMPNLNSVKLGKRQYIASADKIEMINLET